MPRVLSAMPQRVCLLPLDGRPVCYEFARRLMLAAGLEPCLPAVNLLGQLKQPANLAALQRWVKHHLTEQAPVIVALDMVAYGGLIPSRVGAEPFSLLKERLSQFFETVKTPYLYAFSSILRIPAYNNAQEEPDYWATYGKTLYEYSVLTHQQAEIPTVEGVSSLVKLEAALPEAVLTDFKTRRQRNHHLNQTYLAQVANQKIAALVYCQDDTGTHGLNVHEAQALQAEIESKALQPKASVQTGADEVATTLLCRWLVEQSGLKPTVWVAYSLPDGKKTTARFDGVSIETVIAQRLRACGVTLAKNQASADILWVVHVPDGLQGDHCENILAKTTPQQVPWVIETLKESQGVGKPVVLVDLAYANGADPVLIEALLRDETLKLHALYSYAAWNTPGNAAGSALSVGVIRWIAEQQGKSREPEFRRLLLVRLADDGLYQAQVRGQLRQTRSTDENQLNALMADGLALLKHRLDLDNQPVSCYFPCGRDFEVEIRLE